VLTQPATPHRILGEGTDALPHRLHRYCQVIHPITWHVHAHNHKGSMPTSPAPSHGAPTQGRNLLHCIAFAIFLMSCPFPDPFLMIPEGVVVRGLFQAQSCSHTF
jgi:hypothetical protein